ncbi:hypothetical protein [Peribacillus deserti]|nr:hypothetical protein [Peribacillus deserti]
MGNGRKKDKENEPNRESGWNRALFASPTVGGFIVASEIVIYFIVR